MELLFAAREQADLAYRELFTHLVGSLCTPQFGSRSCLPYPCSIPKILPRLLLLSKFVVLLFDSLVIDDTVVAAVVDCNPIE